MKEPYYKLFKLLSIHFCVLALLIGEIQANAQPIYTIESIPDPKEGVGRGYVSNPDDILSSEEVFKLNQLISTIANTTTAQIAVVIVYSIGEENPKEFATRLFQYWGIGYADTDNGLLVFTVVDQFRTEIETGYGLEAILPDIVCYRIGMQELVPNFSRRQYGQGFIDFITRVKEILEAPEVVEEIRSKKSPYRQASENSSSLLWSSNSDLSLFDSKIRSILFITFALIFISFIFSIQFWNAKSIDVMKPNLDEEKKLLSFFILEAWFKNNHENARRSMIAYLALRILLVAIIMSFSLFLTQALSVGAKFHLFVILTIYIALDSISTFLKIRKSIAFENDMNHE